MVSNILHVKIVFSASFRTLNNIEKYFNPLVVARQRLKYLSCNFLDIHVCTYKLYMYICITFKCFRICIHVQIKFLTSDFYI